MKALLLLAAVILFSLHYLHLTADFPNHSPWMDWAKYTDEGWYGDAAIRHFQRGSWYLPGDFNPAAALPVWPLIEAALFRFTGVSLVAARALSVSIFGLSLIAVYALLRRFRVPGLTADRSFAPAVAVLLLAASPFCYAFSRLAILEPPLVLLMLLALLAASMPQHTPLRRAASILALGLLIPAMVLTKTTAVFLLPSIFWLMWASNGYRLRVLLRSAVPSLALALLIWGGYFSFIVRPHFLGDYRYLFAANTYTRIHKNDLLSVLWATFIDGLWTGILLYPFSVLASLAAIAAAIHRRRMLDPLTAALLLWIGGYLSFLAFHNNLQPRYYLVTAVPMTMLLTHLAECLLVQRKTSATNSRRRHLQAAAAVLATAALTLLLSTDILETLGFVRHPEYTFTTAAASLRRIVLADPTHSHLVLSISGSDLSLITGLPSICDDFGTMELPDRIATYRPGWFATWNEVEDDKMDALASYARLQRVAAFAAFDDPERNILILYRLDPYPAHPVAAADRRAHPPARLHKRLHSLRDELRVQPAPSPTPSTPSAVPHSTQ